VSLLNSREEENELRGQRALDKFGPGGLSGRLNDETYKVKSGLFSLPFSQDVFGTQFAPRYAKGKDAKPPSLATYAKGRDKIDRNKGEIEGKGTPTSDSNPAMVSDEEAILVPDFVQALKAAFGEDFIKKGNELFASKGAETMMKDGVIHAASGLTPEELARINASDPYANAARASEFSAKPSLSASGVAQRLSGAETNALGNAINLKRQGFGQSNLNTGNLNNAPRPAVNELGQALEKPPAPNFKESAGNLFKNAAGPIANSTLLASELINSPTNVNQINSALASAKEKTGLSGTPFSAFSGAPDIVRAGRTFNGNFIEGGQAPSLASQVAKPPVLATPQNPADERFNKGTEQLYDRGLLPDYIKGKVDREGNVIGQTQGQGGQANDFISQRQAIIDQDLETQRQGLALRQQYAPYGDVTQLPSLQAPSGGADPQMFEQQKLDLEKEQSLRPAPKKFAANDGQVYQQEGGGAEEFNTSAQQKASGAQKAWTRFFDTETTPEQKTDVSKWLQDNDKSGWLDYLRKSNLGA